MIASYNIDGVFYEYIPGTRKWLYDAANEWLMSNRPNDGFGASINAGSQENEALQRMFLLFAGPGMGKSVFSAAIDHQLIQNRTKSLKGFKLVSSVPWLCCW